jgi:hypothetical protein
MKRGAEVKKESKDLRVAYPDLFDDAAFRTEQMIRYRKTRLVELVKDGHVHPFDYFDDHHAVDNDTWTVIGLAIHDHQCGFVEFLLRYADPLDNDRSCRWNDELNFRETCLERAIHRTPYMNSPGELRIQNLLFDRGVDPFLPMKDIKNVGCFRLANLFLKTAYENRYNSVWNMVHRFRPGVDEVRMAIQLMNMGCMRNDRVLDDVNTHCQSYIDATIARDAACTALVWTCERGIGSEWRDFALIFGERFRLHTDLSGWGFDDGTNNDSGLPNKTRKL